MTAQRADDREDGYLTAGATEAPLPAEPLSGDPDVSPEHDPEGDPSTLDEQDLYDVPDDAPTPHEGHIMPSHGITAAICAGLCAAAVAAGVAWLIVRSRRRESPTRRAAKRAARQFSERSRRAAAHGSELVEPFEGRARRGVATSLDAAARLRRRASRHSLATSLDAVARLRRRAETLRRR